MGFPLDLALRYMRSRKRSFISISTVFAIVGVALGTAALAVVMSVTGGFRAEFRDKVLGVNAHVIVLKGASEYREYREVIAKLEQLPEVIGANPFIISPVMITHAGRTATGVTIKAVDPQRLASVLDLPRNMVEGSIQGLAPPGRPHPSERSVEAEVSDAGSGGTAAAAPLVQAQPEAPDDPLDAPALTLDADDLAPGSLVPHDGYESELPEDDALPEELDADPCAADAAALPGIILGIGLKQTLAVALGDCVQVTSPTIGYSFLGGQLRPPVAKQFRVTGTFQAGFDQYDSRFVYTELHEAQAFYQGGDTVTGVELKIADVDRAPEVARQVEEALADPLYHVIDWGELNRGLFTALKIQQVLMSLVLGLIILVASFTVIATLIMVVLDKKKEIAVLKAMGATDSALLRAFLYQGLIVGLLGAAAGLGVGLVVCRWILAYRFPLDPKVYFISSLPVQMQAREFVLTGLFALFACLAATVWPALHAARLRPAEGFRDL